VRAIDRKSTLSAADHLAPEHRSLTRAFLTPPTLRRSPITGLTTAISPLSEQSGLIG
jgi:hypothetical protein